MSFSFFSLPPPDHSDSDLRTVLVHLIAITMGCSKSTHLWYAIFQLGDLINTYMSGFMVSGGRV